MFVDSHCHLDCIDLAVSHEGSFQCLMDEILAQKVSHMLCVSIELETLPNIIKLVDIYPQLYFSVGIHPNVKLEEEPSDQALLAYSEHSRCIAIGETGLDYYRLETEADKSWQQQRFRQHIRLANQLDYPVIVHTRQAAADTLAILKEEQARKVIMHCFAEDWLIAEQCLQLGYYISLSGIVTFKNARAVHEVATRVPLSQLLIETDSPYLAPTPFRGKQNNPSLLPLICQRIAELREQSIEDVAQATRDNFFRLCNLPDFIGT